MLLAAVQASGDDHVPRQPPVGAPGLAAAARCARSSAFPPPTGLNENLAREILELHTLGVNGGYTQADVTEFARVLTGWTVRPIMNVPGGGAPGFGFDPARHEPGARTLLGKTYAEDGVAQGEAVLRDLAAHPATAKLRRDQARAPFHRRRAAARRRWRASRARSATPTATCRRSTPRCSTARRPGSARSPS